MPGTMKDTVYTEQGLQSLCLAFHLEDLPWLDWPPQLPYPVPFGSRWLLNSHQQQQKMDDCYRWRWWSLSHDLQSPFTTRLAPDTCLAFFYWWYQLSWRRLPKACKHIVSSQGTADSRKKIQGLHMTAESDFLLPRIAEEQAGCCLRFKPRHAFSPERSGIEAMSLEAKRGCQVVHRWQNQVRCVEESPCSLAEEFVSWVRVVSNFTPLIC